MAPGSDAFRLVMHVDEEDGALRAETVFARCNSLRSLFATPPAKGMRVVG